MPVSFAAGPRPPHMVISRQQDDRAQARPFVQEVFGPRRNPLALRFQSWRQRPPGKQRTPCNQKVPMGAASLDRRPTPPPHNVLALPGLPRPPSHPISGALPKSRPPPPHPDTDVSGPRLVCDTPNKRASGPITPGTRRLIRPRQPRRDAEPTRAPALSAGPRLTSHAYRRLGTSSTGWVAARATASATLPKTMCWIPRRPWVPTTTKSAPQRAASSTITMPICWFKF